MECDLFIIVGGDFNVIFDEVLDGWEGNKKRKEFVKYVEELYVEYDFIDILCICNFLEIRFIWC